MLFLVTLFMFLVISKYIYPIIASITQDQREQRRITGFIACLPIFLVCFFLKKWKKTRGRFCCVGGELLRVYIRVKNTKGRFYCVAPALIYKICYNIEKIIRSKAMRNEKIELNKNAYMTTYIADKIEKFTRKAMRTAPLCCLDK